MARSHSLRTMPPCETMRKVSPFLRSSVRRAVHFLEKAASPTERISSMSMISDSMLMAMEKPRRAIIPEEYVFTGE